MRISGVFSRRRRGHGQDRLQLELDLQLLLVFRRGARVKARILIGDNKNAICLIVDVLVVEGSMRVNHIHFDIFTVLIDGVLGQVDRAAAIDEHDGAQESSLLVRRRNLLHLSVEVPVREHGYNSELNLVRLQQ